jgi:hypothetical protein
MLDLVALVDDHVPPVLLDYVLDFIGLVTGYHGKTIPLATNALVLSERYQHTALASGFPALALELELVVRGGPVRRALVESGDPIVHRTHHVFVPSLALEPFVHGPDPIRSYEPD